MSSALYKKTYTVRWADIDANWHMKNTAYLEYTTQLRFSFLAENGFTPEQFTRHNIGPVILKEQVEYLREIKMNEDITVTLFQQEETTDNSRFVMHHEIYRKDGVKAARLQVEGGWLDLKTRKLVSPPVELANILKNIKLF